MVQPEHLLPPLMVVLCEHGPASERRELPERPEGPTNLPVGSRSTCCQKTFRSTDQPGGRDCLHAPLASYEQRGAGVHPWCGGAE